MKVKSTSKTTIYYMDVEPFPVTTREGSAEVTSVRVSIDADDGYTDVTYHGYRTRKDGKRAANASHGQVFPKFYGAYDADAIAAAVGGES